MSSLTVHDTRKIFLANDNVRGILAIYEAERPDGQPQPPKTFFKTFDQTIKVGDYILVPTNTRHNMTVNKVVAVDVECELANQTPATWVIGKIDRRPYEQTLAKEGEMLNIIAAAEKKKMQDELKATVFANVDETKIKTLAIANMGGEGRVEDKTS
jgi:hypothetical protein